MYILLTWNWRFQRWGPACGKAVATSSAPAAAVGQIVLAGVAHTDLGMGNGKRMWNGRNGENSGHYVAMGNISD